MEKLNQLLHQFETISTNPDKQMEKYRGEGKKIIGCFPYYAPEELVQAAGMIPFGIWGSNGAINAAKEYFPSFYCSLAQMNLELGLTGALNGLSGVVVTSMCDTLRPLSQNFRVGVPHIPFMFLAHPQNRRLDCGIQFTIDQYTSVKVKLEEIAGKEITNEELKNAIKVLNESRVARRKFIKLAGIYPDRITPLQRSYVLKSAFFTEKVEYTALLNELNNVLENLPVIEWKGTKIVTSGIILDSPNLLKILEKNNIAIAADDVAHESRAIRMDVPDHEDGMMALALQFSKQDYDTLLYDPELNKRPKHIVDKVNENNADGAIVVMMQFCDPEEMEYPSLKEGLDVANIPHIQIGYDQQMTDFGQAQTSIQAFSDILSLKKLKGRLQATKEEKLKSC
jgi:bcr-type benzoyl-CoA reductase subunit C